MPTRFDLLTVDVVEPRRTAAEIVDRTSFEIELDEDAGRWIVLASATVPQRFGLQRSDKREVDARTGDVEDVLDGCLTLVVADPPTTANFFENAVGLSESGPSLELDGRPVLQLRAGVPEPSNLHLDFACEIDDFADEVERLLDLGATRVGAHRFEHWGQTQIFAIPGGGLFCLNAYAS